ncbi:MAG TPA: guanylate kinase [Steroidobacteraceae bacterium]|nr:guanylate kinase [Steroidobacteraceae bacterium]
MQRSPEPLKERPGSHPPSAVPRASHAPSSIQPGGEPRGSHPSSNIPPGGEPRSGHPPGSTPPGGEPLGIEPRGGPGPIPGSGLGRLYVIAAPSGAGKTSLVKALMQREPRMRFSVSYTTRQPRPNEVDGRDYHFVTQARFQEMVARDEFLEHARVYDNFYGTGLNAVQSELQNGRLLLLEIDWQGARQVRARLPAAPSIFILPPTRRALEERLRARSTDSEEVIERRLRDAGEDLTHYSEFDYVVVNDQFEQALADLLAIVHGNGDALAATRPEIAHLAAGLLAP